VIVKKGNKKSEIFVNGRRCCSSYDPGRAW
jgi:hypothetical protein